MNLFLTIFTASLSGIIGYFVLKRDPRNVMHITFTMFCVSLAFWAIANYFSITVQNVTEILFWMRVVMVFAVMICISFFLFIYAFPNSKLQLRKQYLVLLFLVSVVTCVVALSPVLFSDVTFDDKGGRSPVVQPGMVLFLIVTVGSLLWSFILLIKKLKRSTSINKMQLRFILLGTFIMFFCILLFNLVFPVVFKISFFVNATPFFILPFIVSVFYAITRHRFLDIRIIIRKTTVYIVSIVCILFINLTFYWIEINYFKDAIPSGMGVSIALFLSLLIYNPLKMQFEKIANKYFFYSLYNTQQTLISLSEKLTSIIDLYKVIDSILKTITQSMGLERIAILLLNSGVRDIKYRIPKIKGFNRRNAGLVISNNYLRNHLRRTRQPLIIEELSSLYNSAKSNEERTNIRTLQSQLQKMEAALCIPLISKEKLIGVIVLGNKISKDAYTINDLELLSSLANQAAIAIENATLYDEVQDLNINLQKRIDEATEEIRHKNVHLQELIKMKTEFLDIASHQLRTPLTSIRGLLSMQAAGDLDKLAPSDKKHKQKIMLNEVERLNNIVNDILDALSLEGGPKLDFETASINEIISEAVNFYGEAYKQKGLYLKFQPDKNLPKIQVAPKFLYQVFANLIDNAMKYTKRGGTTIKTKKGKNGVVIEVCDTGIGIKPEDQGRLFEKFSRGKEAASQNPNGSGLGLFIVKKVVDEHYGKVEIESKGENTGATFRVSIPFTQSRKDFTK